MAAQDEEVKERKVPILREGELLKKSSVLKKWRARFVVLSQEMLCIFRREEDESKGRTAQDRIFVMDITSLDNYESKKMKNCFIILADGRSHIFSCPSETDRRIWKRMIKLAQDGERKEEDSNPVRKRSIKLTAGLKRLRIHRKAGQGLGCTIKNVGGVIFVSRILEDGPVSTTGALRPGDQIIDINGIAVSNLAVAEISEIIKSSPDTVICTVKPVTSDKIYETDLEQKRSEYAVLDLEALKKLRELDRRNDEIKTKKSDSLACEDATPKNDTQCDSLPARPPKKKVEKQKEGPDLHYADLEFKIPRDPGQRSPVINYGSRLSQPVTKSPGITRTILSNDPDQSAQYRNIQLDFGDEKIQEKCNDRQQLIQNKKQKSPLHEKKPVAENLSTPV